jgi:hypothetical protein
MIEPPERTSGEAPAAPGGGGRFSAMLRRHPRRWFWGTLVVALLVGVGIGGASASDQAQLDKLDRQLADVRGELRETRGELERTSGQLGEATDRADDLQAELDDANATVKRLSAKGEVPDLTGGTVSDAEDAVTDFEWKIKTVSRATSDAKPGTVIAQVPREGTVLRNGRSVTLTVAKKPPPSWKTIFSFSGSGSRKSDEFRVPDGKVRISYAFTGNTNAILEIGVPGDEFGGELLLNEIGDYSDTTRVYGHAGQRFLDVEGGSWNIQVQVFK